MTTTLTAQRVARRFQFLYMGISTLLRWHLKGYKKTFVNARQVSSLNQRLESVERAWTQMFEYRIKLKEMQNTLKPDTTSYFTRSRSLFPLRLGFPGFFHQTSRHTIFHRTHLPFGEGYRRHRPPSIKVDGAGWGSTGETATPSYAEPASVVRQLPKQGNRAVHRPLTE